MSPRTVRIVVDAGFGKRLEQVVLSGPMWIADTAANRSAAEECRRAYPDQDLTLFRVALSDPPDRWVGDILDTVAEHFGGSDVHRPSFDAIEIIGASLTSELRDQLTQAGYAQFEEAANSFTARYPEPVV